MQLNYKWEYGCWINHQWTQKCFISIFRFLNTVIIFVTLFCFIIYCLSLKKIPEIIFVLYHKHWQKTPLALNINKNSEVVAAKVELITTWRQRKACQVLATDGGGWHPQGRQSGTDKLEAERIVPWGVLGLEGLLRACCARWWATSARGSHKTQVASGAIRSQGKGHQEARERQTRRT